MCPEIPDIACKAMWLSSAQIQEHHHTPPSAADGPHDAESRCESPLNNDNSNPPILAQPQGESPEALERVRVIETPYSAWEAGRLGRRLDVVPVSGRVGGGSTRSSSYSQQRACGFHWPVALPASTGRRNERNDSSASVAVRSVTDEMDSTCAA